MLIELQHISKQYDQPGTDIRTHVLDDISLNISKNESVAIVGPSGSGKSTLLNIIGTLDKPGSGNVMINGQSIASLDEKALASLRNQTIGFVFQMHQLLPQLNLIENVLLPVLPIKDKSFQESALSRAHALLEKVGLKSHLYHHPFQMSVGECQRAALVRALINQPEILLADEPTGSLDADNAQLLAQILLDMKNEQKTALVLVTHSPELAAKMDKVYHLSHGKLALTH